MMLTVGQLVMVAQAPNENGIGEILGKIPQHSSYVVKFSSSSIKELVNERYVEAYSFSTGRPKRIRTTTTTTSTTLSLPPPPRSKAKTPPITTAPKPSLAVKKKETMKENCGVVTVDPLAGRKKDQLASLPQSSVPTLPPPSLPKTPQSLEVKPEAPVALATAPVVVAKKKDKPLPASQEELDAFRLRLSVLFEEHSGSVKEAALVEEFGPRTRFLIQTLDEENVIFFQKSSGDVYRL